MILITGGIIFKHDDWNPRDERYGRWQYFWAARGNRAAKRQISTLIGSCIRRFPEAVRVELYADGVDGGIPVRQEMTRVRQLVGATGGYIYSAAVSAARPPTDYTGRVIPYCDGVVVPLEVAPML